jgi:alkylhydroperoxidase family enzyme
MSTTATTNTRIDYKDFQAVIPEMAHFSEREVAFLTTAIGQINFWNRGAAPLRFTPPIPASSWCFVFSWQLEACS